MAGPETFAALGGPGYRRGETLFFFFPQTNEQFSCAFCRGGVNPNAMPRFSKRPPNPKLPQTRLRMLSWPVAASWGVGYSMASWQTGKNRRGFLPSNKS